MDTITYPIFGFETVLRTLQTFANAVEVQDRCGGLDIAEGDWLFWDAHGNALEACYSERPRVDPDKATCSHGTYILKSGTGPNFLAFMASRCDSKPVYLWTFEQMESYFRPG